MRGTFTFLGTGGSAGVPIIGCTCDVCTSSSPYNRRLRTSGLLNIDGKTMILDVGPDFRTQALRLPIRSLDAVLLTHSHFDHIGGIDDLRPFNFFQKKQIPCLLSRDTFEELKIRYHYLIHPSQSGKTLSAQLEFHLLEKEFGRVHFMGIDWDVVTYAQAGMKVTGYRVGSFAYISDIRDYDETLFASLQGVETLILSALRLVPSEVHFSLDEAIAFAERVGARQTYLTHMTHELDYEKLSPKLPPRIQMGYDGLMVNF